MNSPLYIPNWQYHSKKDITLDFVRKENMLRRALHRGKTIIKKNQTNLDAIDFN